MGVKEKLIEIKDQDNSVVVDENLIGLAWMRKVFASGNGDAAFLSSSKLDLDTDGVEEPGITYEEYHQSQTSIDPNGHWLNSNKLNYYVLPGGFATLYHGVKRHGGVDLGCLATIVYGEKVAHAVFADTGPTNKFGEGSINLHRSLGFERVRPDGTIRDIGIDDSVWILIYIGSKIPQVPCTQAEIDAAAAPHWADFMS